MLLPWDSREIAGRSPSSSAGRRRTSPGVFKTATDFFEAAAKDGNNHGFNIQVISQSPATHTAFADQVAIIEDYIQRGVDVIAISPIEVEVIKPALAKANAKGIPVIIVNLLEPIAGVEVASYIGFDNAVGAEVSAYAVLDYFGGPGVLGTGKKVNVTRRPVPGSRVLGEAVQEPDRLRKRPRSRARAPSSREWPAGSSPPRA